MHALVVSEQGTRLHADGDLLIVQRGESRLRSVRATDIDQVVLLGRVELTSGALSMLLRRQIDLVLLNQQGKFRGRLSGRAAKNVQLRLTQYRQTTDPTFCLKVARAIVVAKIRHQRQLLLRAQRRLQDDRLADALGNLRLASQRAETSTDLDVLRGLEGHAAALYFGQFGKLIRNDAFEFSGRNRRPPRDPVNALLSFGYAVVGSLLENELYRCGLDPMLGCLHQPAFGRPSLMLDLLEEYRPLIDALVLRIVNRRQIGPEDFERKSAQSLEEILQEEDSTTAEGDRETGEWFEPIVLPDTTATDDDPHGAAPTPETPAVNGGPIEDPNCNENWAVLLSDVGRRIVLHELFRRLREKMMYPPRSGQYELRDIFREQAYHFARVLEGNEEAYVPFVPS